MPLVLAQIGDADKPDSFRPVIDSLRRSRGNAAAHVAMISGNEVGMRAAKLRSSMIERIDYEDERRTLGITFRDSRRYLYFEVPRTIYDGMRAAPSAGRYFNDRVKGRFRCIPDPARRRFRPDA